MTIKCPCGQAEYQNVYHRFLGYGDYWTLNVPHAEESIFINYCPNCGRELNEEGTFGKEYSDLKAENLKLQKQLEELKKKH